MGQEFNVLALVKGQEHYIFVYDDESRQTLIDSFRDQAADPVLSFNWFDAAVLTQKAREQASSLTPAWGRPRKGIVRESSSWPGTARQDTSRMTPDFSFRLSKWILPSPNTFVFSPSRKTLHRIP